MRRLTTLFLSIIFIIMMGCGAASTQIDQLEMPEQRVSETNNHLTKEERTLKEKELKARIKLLEILTQIEEDIKSKSKKAEFFDFALKDNDRTTLAAAQILLKHIARSKTEIEAEIIQLHEELN